MGNRLLELTGYRDAISIHNNQRLQTRCTIYKQNFHPEVVVFSPAMGDADTSNQLTYCTPRLKALVVKIVIYKPLHLQAEKIVM